MQVALIRHLPPVIAPGVCYGRSDVAARVVGTAELDAIRLRVAHLHVPRLLSSPARRCRMLAERLGAALGIVPALDDRLLELDFGEWERARWEEVDRAALDAWATDPGRFVPPGGEPVSALLARVAAFARDLRASGCDAIVVSHGGPLRLLGPMLRGEAADCCAPVPGFGGVTLVAPQPASAVSTVSTAHSVTCSAAPSTSPV
jgi:alpha-ribazole phosphatase